MWTWVVTGALAADVSVSAGLQDLSGQGGPHDGARAAVDLHATPFLSVSLQGSKAFGRPLPDDLLLTAFQLLGVQQWSVTRSSVTVLLDGGFGPPDGRTWGAAPHLLVGPTLHERLHVDNSQPNVTLPAHRPWSGGIAVGGALDVWYGRIGARFSVIDHELREDPFRFGEPRFTSVVAYGLDVRARL